MKIGTSTTATSRTVPGLLTIAGLALTVPILLLASSLLLQLLPVRLEVRADGASATVTVDGTTRTVPLSRTINRIRFVPVEPHRREQQVDGSETVTIGSFDRAYFAQFGDSLYYRFQSLLRDEAGYSAWANLAIRDDQGTIVVSQPHPVSGAAIDLPQPFQLSVDLQRPEVARTIELLDESNPVLALEIDRSGRSVRVYELAAGSPPRELAGWYFPTDWRPFAAEIAYTGLRTAALGLTLLIVVTALGALLPGRPLPTPGRRASRLVPALLAAGTLALSTYAAVALFDRAPHVLDAISYYFQAKIFAGGSLAAPAPPVPEAFPTPFMIVHDGKWFSQYPPGTSLLYALGFLLQVPWLVGPLLVSGATLLVGATGRRQFGLSIGLLAGTLIASSPWLHLQAGLFMSHGPAMFFAAVVLYAAARYAELPTRRWVGLGSLALGYLLLTREVVALLYGLPIGLFLAYEVYRRRRERLPGDLGLAGLCLLPFAAAYLLYNWSLTGSPFLLPRHLVNAGDRLGFGPGIGFYGEHTLAAGLTNTDQLLTSLNIYLYGWPFYFALALPALPFLLRRATRWDVVHASIVVLFIAAFVAYFYHGIIVGPRYYFEMLPALALLSARGFAALAGAAAGLLAALGRHAAQARASSAVAALLLVLLLCNALYFGPRQIELYRGYAGMSGGKGPALGDFVRRDLIGRVPDLEGALLTTSDFWVYASYFAALNCPRLDCGAVFALASDRATRERLQAAFPGRDWYPVFNRNRELVIPSRDRGPVPAPLAPTSTPPEVVWPVPPAQTIVAESFDDGASAARGDEPIESAYQLTAGRSGWGALLAKAGYLAYEPLSIDAREGAMALWVQPLWDGADGQTYVFMEIGAGSTRYRLAKDGANNLRFHIWNDGKESGAAFSVRNWRRGEWHHVAGVWGVDGRLARLFVDGELVAEGAARVPERIEGVLRVGVTQEGAHGCECVVDDVSLAQGPAATLEPQLRR